jgi:hypothetical protein
MAQRGSTHPSAYAMRITKDLARLIGWAFALMLFSLAALQRFGRLRCAPTKSTTEGLAAP